MKSMELFDEPLKIYLTLGIVFIVTGAVFLGIVVWSNTGSRNLVLAASTLVGAFVMFLIQLPLELKEKVNTDFTRVEFMIDREEPVIRQQKYQPAGGWRIGQEVGASNYLSKAYRAQFDGSREHREQLATDLTIFSLISFMGAEQYDWRYKTVNLQGQTMGTMQPMLVTDSKECTLIPLQEIQEKLAASGNLFAKAPLFVMGKRLCLPPNSSLDVSREKIEITTPFCNILFEALPSGTVNFMSPLPDQEAPVMVNGEPRFETRLVSIRATVTYSWIRAQDQKMKQYEDWSSRVVDGARNWFEKN